MPRDVAAEDWRGLAQVLRLLEATWPGCTGYDPETTLVVVSRPGDSLLEEAERFAALEIGRPSRRP